MTDDERAGVIQWLRESHFLEAQALEEGTAPKQTAETT